MCIILFLSYCKIPKICPGLIFFEGLFWGAYFWRGLYSELGAYLWREIVFQNGLGSFIVGRKFTLFALFYFVFEGNFRVQAPRRGGWGGGGGGLYLMGQLEEWFTMVLFLSLTQVITRLVFSASPLIYWYAAYVIISDSTEPPYRHCRSKWKSQLILGYFLLYFFIGTALHCNFYPWTW